MLKFTTAVLTTGFVLGVVAVVSAIHKSGLQLTPIEEPTTGPKLAKRDATTPKTARREPIESKRRPGAA